MPVVSLMEVRQIGQLDGGRPRAGRLPQRDGPGADGLIVCNRVKPYTDFRGELESGLAKITAIGLGKHQGQDDPLLRDAARALDSPRRAPDRADGTRAGWTGRAGERLRPDGPRRRRAPGRDRRAGRRGPPGGGPGLDGLAAVRPDRRPDRGRDGEERQRDGDGHQHHRAHDDPRGARVPPPGRPHRGGAGPDRGSRTATGPGSGWRTC